MRFLIFTDTMKFFLIISYTPQLFNLQVQILGGPIVDASDASKEDQSSEDFAMSTYSEGFF